MNGHFLKKNLSWAAVWGSALTVVQILICFLISLGNQSFKGKSENAFLKLNQWDSFHYFDIVDRGYQLPEGVLSPTDVHSNRANVGYFPAYPYFTRGLKNLIQVSTPVANLITAQLFCFLFWTQLLLLYLWFGASRPESLKNATPILLFPSAFFLVTGYSESLFMASLLGMILCTELWVFTSQGKKLNHFWFGAAIWGFLLSATRLVGIPLFIFPLLRIGYINVRAWILSVLIASGGLAFFIGCQKAFGQWDVYFKLQMMGWQNKPDYLAIFYPASYIPRFFLEDTTNSVCRLSNLAILVFLLKALRAEIRIHDFVKARIGLYISAFILFYIPLAGKARYDMDSMVRYNLPVFLLLVLSYHQVNRNWISSKSKKFKIAIAAIAVVIQLWMILVFVRGGWVA